MLVVACAGGSNGGDVIAASDSAAVADSAAAAGSLAAAGSDAECPEMGEWRTCSVEKRLERAGFVAVRQDTAVRHPFLAVPGTVYRLGADELQVFLYASADARTRDLAGVDSATVSPRGARVRWSATPTLIVSNNLAAVLIGGTSRQVERVVLALTAGLPQP